jgi:hypothetical protein
MVNAPVVFLFVDIPSRASRQGMKDRTIPNLQQNKDLREDLIFP